MPQIGQGQHRIPFRRAPARAVETCPSVSPCETQRRFPNLHGKFPQPGSRWNAGQARRMTGGGHSERQLLRAASWGTMISSQHDASLRQQNKGAANLPSCLQEIQRQCGSVRRSKAHARRRNKAECSGRLLFRGSGWARCSGSDRGQRAGVRQNALANLCGERNHAPSFAQIRSRPGVIHNSCPTGKVAIHSFSKFQDIHVVYPTIKLQESCQSRVVGPNV